MTVKKCRPAHCPVVASANSLPEFPRNISPFYIVVVYYKKNISQYIEKVINCLQVLFYIYKKEKNKIQQIFRLHRFVVNDGLPVLKERF